MGCFGTSIIWQPIGPVVARHYDRHKPIQCHLTTNITVYAELLCAVLLQRKFVQVSSSVVYLSDRFSAQVVEVHVVQLFANTMSLYRKCTQISRFIIIHLHKIFVKHAGCRVCLLNNTNKCPRSMPSVLWRCWLGGRKGIRPVKNWVAVCWHGYLSGARCRLAYGPVDATATHCLLLQ